MTFIEASSRLLPQRLCNSAVKATTKNTQSSHKEHKNTNRNIWSEITFSFLSAFPP